MADKSPQEEIANHEKEIADLRQKADELERKAKFQEFPKWVPDVTDPTGQRGFTVENAEQEAKARAGQMVAPQSASQKLQSEEIRRKAKEDEDAALALRDEADELTRKKQGKASTVGAGASTAPAGEAKGVGDGTVSEARDLVAAATTKRELNSLESAENRRDGGPRQGVIDAIERKRAELGKE